MAAVAFETPLGFEHRLWTAPERPTALVEAIDEPAAGAIEPWELHSELVLACPEVRKRALELLPERDPDALFLARGPRLSPTDRVARQTTTLPAVVAGYVLWRLLETARSALIAVGAVVALAVLAEAVD